MSNSIAPQAQIFAGAGFAGLFSFSPIRGAERRAAHQHFVTLHRRACETHLCGVGISAQSSLRRLRRLICVMRCRASRRSTAAISVPGTMRIRPDKHPAGFRPRSSGRVLPLKAIPRSRDGRRPEASRDVIASHAAGAAPAPPTERLMMTPPDEQVGFRLAELMHSVQKNALQ
jgi:hypothetical protein